MAKKTEFRINYFAVLIIILVTLLLLPQGVLYRLRIAIFSATSSALQKTGISEHYTTENKHLYENNERLTRIIKEQESEISALKKELKLFKRIGKSTVISRDHLVPAKVIFYDPKLSESRVTLNRGVNHGVVKGLTVVEGDSLLGTVIFVSESTCEVLLLNDPHAAFSVYVGKERITAICKGQGKGRKLRIEYIDNQPENIIHTKDIVVTSGFASETPPLIPVGAVSNNPSHDTEEYDSHLHIEVKPYINTLMLRQVFIFLPERLSRRDE